MARQEFSAPKPPRLVCHRCGSDGARFPPVAIRNLSLGLDVGPIEDRLHHQQLANLARERLLHQLPRRQFVRCNAFPQYHGAARTLTDYTRMDSSSDSMAVRKVPC
jgi:hypothetical protein